jgi:hypothetical protein
LFNFAWEALWRLADSYPAAQTEVLGVLPKLAAQCCLARGWGVL